MSILVAMGLKVPRRTRPKSNISTIQGGTCKEGTTERNELISSLVVPEAKQANFYLNERACGNSE